ncbi:MAG: hypothetical protein IJO87_00295 [Eggerthellaceae bacterium]|nr:hypothetical protein [Eggerthellaceae bacterium]
MADLITELKDLTHLTWDERATTSGTGGAFLKARDALHRTTRYYKLSCYDAYRGIYGHECVNELIVSRLLEALRIPHVSYRLVRARVLVDGVERVTWVSESESYRADDEKKQAFDVFYDLRREAGESPIEFCTRYGWRSHVEQMLLVDYLVANRDRHGANIEVLRSPSGAVRLAPLFDHGLCFVFSAYDDEGRAAAFDPLSDVNANNFIGTRSLRENLRFVRGPLDVGSIDEGQVDSMLGDLQVVLPKAHREKIKEIILTRWAVARDLGIVS